MKILTIDHIPRMNVCTEPCAHARKAWRRFTAALPIPATVGPAKLVTLASAASADA
jgi:hypothetical protein